MATAPSLRDYVLLEIRHTDWRAPLLMAIAGIGGVAGTHAILPRLPDRAIHFMAEGFRLEDFAGVLLFNDITAVYFAAFFSGITGLLQAAVAAREENRLELLLVKPVPPSIFLAARISPVLAATMVVGVLVSLACVLAIAPYAQEVASVSSAGALGGGFALTGLTLAQLGALNLAFVRMRDGFHALLIACVVWIVPVIPGAVFLYRPDLFAGREALASRIVMASLIWNDRTTAWLGPVALAAAVPACALLVIAAGAVLEHSDVT